MASRGEEKNEHKGKTNHHGSWCLSRSNNGEHYPIFIFIFLRCLQRIFVQF